MHGNMSGREDGSSASSHGRVPSVHEALNVPSGHNAHHSHDVDMQKVACLPAHPQGQESPTA